MKKLFVLIVAMALMSCSDDNASQTPLLKSIKEIRLDGTTLSVFSYDGNKITTVRRNADDRDVYVYEDDFITSIETMNASQVVRRQTFQYDEQGRLVQYLNQNFANNTGFRKQLTYRPDGHVDQIYYLGSAEAQTVENRPGTIWFNNGVMTGMTFELSGQTIAYEFAYDDKNTPTRNVAGISRLHLAPDIPEGRDHNIRFIAFPPQPVSEAGLGYQYAYNRIGFPVGKTPSGPSSSGESSFQFTYE